MIVITSKDGRPWNLERICCPLCGEGKCRLALTKRGAFIEYDFSIVECRRCHFIYVNPRVSAEQIPLLYDDAYFRGDGFDSTVNYGQSSETNGGIYELAANSVELALGKLQNARVLDFGCGSATFVSILLKRGADAAGVDGSESAVKLAQSRGLPVEKLGESFLRASRAQFDVVTLMEVIEHVTDPIGLLRLAAQCLRPGGLVYVTTGNWNFVRLQNGTPYVMPEGHIGYFDPKTLATAFAKAGLNSRPLPGNQTWIVNRLLARTPMMSWASQGLAKIAVRFTPAWGPFPFGVKEL